MKVRDLQPRSYSEEDLLEAAARARGCTEAAQIAEFLDPEQSIPDPMEGLSDYPAARDRIRRALSDGEPVLLFADYDCDGITALVQMHDFFRAAGHDRLSWFVPDRMSHDYGLTRGGAEECLRRGRPSLLISLDCGSTAGSVIQWLADQGIDCIVVDHHVVPAEDEPLPATAHLNPRAGIQNDPGASSLSQMSASGLVFLFCRSLAADLGVTAWEADRSCLLAGLGTLVDVMPLTGINRALVKRALRLANDPESLALVPGLSALKEVTHTLKVDAGTFGYRWGPRLNASGRLEEATNPVELLLSRDLAVARPLAERCHQTNRERKEMQRVAEDQACLQAEERLAQDSPPKVLLLCDRDWHPGIVGIVASRLRERFARPAIVCAWHEDGYWKGSGRSPEAFDLGGAVQAACQEGLLLSGGGHRMAAGMKISPDKIEAFQIWLDAHCSIDPDDYARTHEVLAPVDALGERDARELSRAWSRLFSRLEPFGAGNPAPGLILRRVELRWGPKAKTRSEGGGAWALSAGFAWSGQGYLFADWTEVAKAGAAWELGGRYDLLLAVSRSDGINRQTGRPITYYDWRVTDCERVL